MGRCFLANLTKVYSTKIIKGYNCKEGGFIWKKTKKDELIKLFNELYIPDMEEVKELYRLEGAYINLNCRLPNGEMAQILNDAQIYYGAELCKKGSERCYGLATDGKQLVVYEYGNGGSDAELVLWKRIKGKNSGSAQV